MDLHEYTEIKERISKLREEAARAKGAANELLRRHNVKTLKQLKKKLYKKKQEQEEADRRYKEKLEKFREEFGDEFG